PLDKDVDLKGLSKETEDMVGSDIEFICRKASMLAIREYISQGSGVRSQESEFRISKRHFGEALKASKNQKQKVRR
ncbi:MAG: hypothetical protein AB1638_11725, partial [Nitrospirota bacterium]